MGGERSGVTEPWCNGIEPPGVEPVSYGQFMSIMPIFRDRFEGGRVLGRRVARSVVGGKSVVLALPRGGVPVGYEVAQALHIELDIFLVRKLGVPGHEELAMGAIASGGVRVLNEALIGELQLSPLMIDQVTAREQREIERRERLYRGDRPALSVAGRQVILVDDGLATGASMLAASRAVRLQHPKRVIVAVPVASTQACEEFKRHVDEVICAATLDPFYAVGVWYEDFSQTTDAEVQELLERAARERIA